MILSSPLTRSVPISPDPSTPSDTSEASTVEDIDTEGFGHPLHRMISVLDDDDGPSPSSSASSLVHDIDFESLVDELLTDYPDTDLDSEDFIIVEPTLGLRDTIMIKVLPRTSPEFSLLLRMNYDEVRQDPWNPVPRILRTVIREERVFVCFERLFDYNDPPLMTVANYIDLLRQCLEGLTFLHEHNITQLSYRDPACLMMAIGSFSIDDFDRSRYPVRYYQTNFTRALKLDTSTSSFAQDRATSFTRDVKMCGGMIGGLLKDVPKIGPKFKSLVKAMSGGEFGAEDARKLFEALCKSLEASVFDTPVPVPVPIRRVPAPSPDPQPSTSVTP